MSNDHYEKIREALEMGPRHYECAVRQIERDEALLRQALEALESSRIFVTTREKIKHPEGTEWYDEAITALRTAIEQVLKEKNHVSR
jgi:hypothetical protein